MIETCSGEKRLELDEGSSTIHHFLQLAAGGTSCIRFLALGQKYSSLLELIRFVKKYECAVAISQLDLHARIPDGGCWSYLRLLLAVHFDMTDHIAHMINREPEVFSWLRPPDGPEPVEMPPYDFFQLLPPRYLWALTAANVCNRQAAAVSVASDGSLLSPKERFLVLLSHADAGKSE